MFLALAAMLIPAAPAVVRPQIAQQPDPHSPTNRPVRVISIAAKGSTFDPAVVQLKVDEKIELDVTAVGQPIGIRISPFTDGAKANTPPGLSFLFGEDCYKIKKDQTVPILIEGTEPGTYTFRCCKACGNHKSMEGRIIVSANP